MSEKFLGQYPPEYREGTHRGEIRYEVVDEIPVNRLDKPRIIKGQNGKLAFGTDEGVNYKPRNEDALVINTKANAFASIDGMGGEYRGDRAARILAEELQKGFREEDPKKNPIRWAQIQAHLRMRNEGLNKGGACYIAGEINGNVMDVYQAGDVKLIVVDPHGRVRFETEDEGYRHFVSNSVQGRRPGRTTHTQVKLNLGDRIIVASDGLWDSYSPQQVAEMVSGKPIKRAIKGINRAAKGKMRSGQGKPDNISVIIYDFERVS